MAHLAGSTGSFGEQLPPTAAVSTSVANAVNSPSIVDAARHLCQEARVVLTSLRGGPPNVARGDLAQDLTDLRQLVKYCLIDPTGALGEVNATTPAPPSPVALTVLTPPSVPQPALMSPPSNQEGSFGEDQRERSTVAEDEEILDEGGAVLVQQREYQNASIEGGGQGSPMRQPTTPTSHQYAAGSPLPHHYHQDQRLPNLLAPQDVVGPFARPFLAVVMDPRAAGPHTLVALRALYRLLERSSLQLPKKQVTPSTNKSAITAFHVDMESLAKGVLSCKFEQTDAGADEAVEMAIADLLALLVRMDRRAVYPTTLMDAFNTVFITRNTFVHSPALCYHFEDVLTSIIANVFSDIRDKSQRDPAARLILEFLVNQLLHTPMLGGDDEASRDAQLANDATRVLCLRLTRCALRYTFADADESVLVAAATPCADASSEDRSLLQVVQDDLSLALLMTGQAIWVNRENPTVAPFISLEVLSEICSTLSTLWTTTCLRKYLVPQFEAIFSGFYQRALVLLRKRVIPRDPITYHANLVFDAGTEVILESLVDIMCLHDYTHNVTQGTGGTIESLFVTYDCNLRRSDIAVDLMVELCRCTGSRVDEEGDRLEQSLHGEGSALSENIVQTVQALQSPPPVEQPSSQQQPQQPQAAAPSQMDGTAEIVGDQFRQVPPHLKELCGEAIIGAMKCMFQDDHPSEQTRVDRRKRSSILADHVEGEAPSSLSQAELLKKAQGSHQLRNIKAQKRLMRRAAQLFNKKASKGIAFLVSSGLVPDPPTPRSVASFLRNGIVVGLDKPAVGAYLGEVGKKPVPGKSPPNWERDWFHKEVLESYCALFRFERQSLLDGLRMFLAAFRLPGESQQIDRILQTFADSCVSACEETHQGLFSSDPKRASDAAYLLSFSIIMLNTDRHNANIREDRKMSKSAFVRNNTDYGRDIMEKGEEFPREYLEAIYDSIRHEEIRTEGEGADGSMTIERWKDVLRGSADDDSVLDVLPSQHDAEDLTELVLEHVWMPIMSSVAALWAVNRSKNRGQISHLPGEAGSSGMLGAQGARLGMDMALEMLVGVRQLARNDIFLKIFKCVAHFSGLLEYSTDISDRAWSFANSVESQSAFLAAFKIAREAGDELGQEGWKLIWATLFELRDLKILGGGVKSRSRSILIETDPDLLKEDARRDWKMKLIKGGREDNFPKDQSSMGVTSIFGSVGRALFGTAEAAPPVTATENSPPRILPKKTVHGKEELYVWDDQASSDDEDDADANEDSDFAMQPKSRVTTGAKFENQLIHEDMLIHQKRETPVTGLERVEDSQRLMLSRRARARKRLGRVSNFASIVSDTRFMNELGIGCVLGALTALISSELELQKSSMVIVDSAASAVAASETETSEIKPPSPDQIPLSPASEALAEVLVCEIALRNRDRLVLLWQEHLRQHYVSRLQSICKACSESERQNVIPYNAGIEKCITGLLRICCCAVQREGIGGEMLSVFDVLDPSKETEGNAMVLLAPLDGHLGEGLWRIARNIDESTKLSEAGWKGLLCLTRWCAYRGSLLPPIRSGIGRPVGLSENDPALQAYRSLHFMLNMSEVRDEIPPATVETIRMLVAAGDKRKCPKLGIAALDLLHAVNGKIASMSRENAIAYRDDNIWKLRWRPALEAMAEASEMSSFSVVRQHSLSMLADSFLDKRGGHIPASHLCTALQEVCVPLAGRRIAHLRTQTDAEGGSDETMIELELCIGLIFKPLRHHVNNIVDEDDKALLLAVWTSVMAVLEITLGEAPENSKGDSAANRVVQTTTELSLEHLRNVIMVLIDLKVLKGEPESPGDISDITWQSIGKINACNKHIDEWRKAVSNAQP